MSIERIEPRVVQERLNSGAECLLLDVRTVSEHRQLHVEGSWLVPLHELKPGKFFEAHPEAKGKEVLLLCKGGTRAMSAADAFVKAGYTNVKVIDGGIMAWQASGLPVVAGAGGGPISVERQTRIVIGVGMIAFTLLGYFVSPLFLVGAGFFGAGMIMAGVTDRCPLALLIAVMPWNSGGGSCPACAGKAKA